jgi:hypothetical protein
MICGSRCLPHVPPRVLPEFVEFNKKLLNSFAEHLRVAKNTTV